eukprot:XP_017946236.1 PREDICTED: lipoma HMGIC fusion partner-like 2 protein isoform X2 [Xenopus tropicalis]
MDLYVYKTEQSLLRLEVIRWVGCRRSSRQISWEQLWCPGSLTRLPFMLHKDCCWDVTGLFLILGLILYPAGWGSQKVVGYCGHYAAAYKLGECSLGWAFYTAIGGTVLTFICAVFSAQAEIATSSDKVQEEIEEGKNLICLL